MVALPSIGFQVAAWLWREGYASARNISLTTGSMGDYCNGTEYSFVELSHKIQNSSTGIEQLFQYWRHTTKVAVFSLLFFTLTPMAQVPMPIVLNGTIFNFYLNFIFFFGIHCLIYSKLMLRTHVCLNLQSWSLWHFCNIHIFLSFLGSLLKQGILFESVFQFSLPPPYTIVCGVRGGVGPLWIGKRLRDAKVI